MPARTPGRAALAAALAVCAAGAAGRPEEKKLPHITDKTLVVWAAPANLTQRGGSALTLENGDDCFDAIVLGELAPAKWMAGSNFLSRTQRQPHASAAETADAKTFVQVAIAYEGKRVTLYRNAALYAQYTVDQPQAFGPKSFAVIGLRHVAAGDGACFAGAIQDARIYGLALTPAQLAALKPNQPSDPKPLAWWTFEDGKAEERMGTFPNTRLFGQAKVADGRLLLDGRGSYLVSARGEAPSWRGRVPPAGGDLIAGARALRARLLADPHRPCYHFVSPEGLCMPFDPNGALFWRGRYHLMYIVQTEKGHSWAHISSTDLVHWRHHPLALEPGGADTGIFSGGAFVDPHGVPTITYWGLGHPGGICIATSTDDDLERWTKSPHNPVIRETAHGLAALPDGTVYGAADPSAIWSRNGRYYLLTGNLLVLREFGLKRKMPEHQGDTLYLFVSDDLAKWTYLHPFYKSDRKWTRADEDNMCPDFFPLGDRHMLLFISHNLGCQYYIGRYADDRFTPETHGRMTWADNHFFAPESLVDAQGRRIMWAWVFDGRTRATQAASGWSGTMSLPRVLSLGEDKTLRIAPPEELARLRYNPRKHEGLRVQADAELLLEDVAGDSLELSVEMAPEEARQFGLKVCCSPDGREQTPVFYDAAEKKLKVDTTHSSLGEGPKVVEGGPLELKPGEPLRLRIFVDRSLVEVFANGRQAIARTIYPTRPDARGVALFSRGGAATATSLEAWDVAPANPW